MKTTTKFTCPAFAALALVCFAVLSTAQAITPPPDGGYPNANTAEGEQALYNLTAGQWNTALGFQALGRDTTGSSNTATGGRALFSNTTGLQNTADGAFALFANTVGVRNSAFGFKALASNTTGLDNVAIGHLALNSNIDSSRNTAIGWRALFSNLGGGSNTAIGAEALARGIYGGFNTATGYWTLYHNNGSFNTANGYHSLFNNTTGNYNTANGVEALLENSTGDGNTAIGSGALQYSTKGQNNTAVGNGALSGLNNTGSGNTALGYGAGSSITTANNVICIGSSGADVSNTILVGNIYGVTTQSSTTATVVVSNTGQLGTVASSERFKKDIATMEKTSEAILSLRPVTFHYKSDTSATPQFGLIAEEVAKVNPALVLPDKEGKPYTVRYDAVNAMLLNEFLKEHKTVQEHEATIAQLKRDSANQQKQIEVLTVGLQKVSAQLELNKPAPQTVLNNR